MGRKERRREKKRGGAAPAAAPAPDSHQALVRAMQRHQAGRLQEAPAIYLRVLKREPENADAHNGLGLALQALGRPVAANLDPDHDSIQIYAKEQPYDCSQSAMTCWVSGSRRRHKCLASKQALMIVPAHHSVSSADVVATHGA